MYVDVTVSARVHVNTDQHKHRHVTTPKGAKRLLKMACNKVCMTARCVTSYSVYARATTNTMNTNREQTLFQVFHDIEGS